MCAGRLNIYIYIVTEVAAGWPKMLPVAAGAAAGEPKRPPVVVPVVAPNRLVPGVRG